MTTYYLNDASLNWILTANNINSNSSNDLTLQTSGVNRAIFNNLGLVLTSGSNITTQQNSNLNLDASNSIISFRRNNTQYAYMDTSFNFVNLPICSSVPTLTNQLVNKSYCDGISNYVGNYNEGGQYTLSGNYMVGASCSLTIPSYWNTFDIDILTCSYVDNINQGNKLQGVIYSSPSAFTNGSTTFPSPFTTLMQTTNLGYNNNTAVMGMRGNLQYLVIDAQTSYTPGNTYYFANVCRMLNSGSFIFYDNFITVKAFRKS